jgi:hypothetical protein
MTVKLLLPAYGKHGSAVVAVDGKLRLVDPPKRICHGFQNGCLCGTCTPRARRAERATAKRAIAPKRCRCDRPMIGDDGDCAKCGKPMRLAAAA